MALKNKIDPSKMFQVVLIVFIVAQGISWLLSELDIFPLISGGWFLLLLLIGVGLTTLFSLGKNITTLEIKRNLLFIVIVFAIIILSFIFLPQLIPQIFSTSSIEFGESIKETLVSIISMGPGGIVYG